VCANRLSQLELLSGPANLRLSSPSSLPPSLDYAASLSDLAMAETALAAWEGLNAQYDPQTSSM